MFVSVKFNPWDQRSYTYTWDGDLLSPGDLVIVDARDEEKIVTVESVDVPEPAFACKPILRRAPEPEDAA